LIRWAALLRRRPWNPAAKATSLKDRLGSRSSFDCSGTCANDNWNVGFVSD